MNSTRLAGRGAFEGGVYRSNTPLTDDQIMRVAPSVFAAEAHESRSARYTYIPTIDVINGMRREGFEPFMIAQGRTRVPGKSDFTKHMIRMRHRRDIATTEANEIILVNSHDGTSSYQLISGMIRFACNNGLVCGENMQDYRVPHKGDIVHQVISHAYETLDGFGLIREVTDEMKRITLRPEEELILAESAHMLRWEPEQNADTGEWSQNAPVAARSLLTARRAEDRNASLWTAFNRVQENVIRGGLQGRTANNRRTSTREVTGIDQNIKLNRALWTLAERMAELKQTA